MLTVPRNAAEILTLQAVLITGSLIGGVACGDQNKPIGGYTSVARRHLEYFSANQKAGIRKIMPVDHFNGIGLRIIRCSNR